MSAPQESNRILAEYQGFYVCDSMGVYRVKGTGKRVWGNLKYHESWDALVPVIRKAMNFLQTMERPSQHHCCKGDLIECDLICHMRELDLPKVYAKTVELVQWITNYTTKQSADE